MKRRIRELCMLLCLALAAAFPAASVFAQTLGIDTKQHTRQEIVSYYNAHSVGQNPVITFASTPNLTDGSYSPGSLSSSTINAALEEMNFIRFVAGLNPVSYDAALGSSAQAAAFLNAVNGSINHTPGKPSGMEDALYNLGYSGAGSSNLWSAFSSGDISSYATVSKAFRSWMDDSSSSNMMQVGHRRWLLNPVMGKTGFGFAGTSHNMYGAVYVQDCSAAASASVVAWPACQMPLEYFDEERPWSVSLDQAVDAGSLKVTITKKSALFPQMSKTWVLSAATLGGSTDDVYTGNRVYLDKVNGYLTSHRSGSGMIGQKGAIIFYPFTTDYDTHAIHEGDSYHVKIEGAPTAIEYDVNFFSVHKVTDFKVPASAELEFNETKTIGATVLPETAPDKNIRVSVEDPSVVEVSVTGRPNRATFLYGNDITLKAKKPGSTVLTVSAGSGAKKQIPVTVKAPVLKLDASALTLFMDETKSLAVTCTPAADVVWKSSNTAVLTVKGGSLTPVGEGSATVTASANGLSASCTVKVAARSISVPAEEIYIPDGKSFQLKPVIRPAVTPEYELKDVRGSISVTSGGLIQMNAPYSSAFLYIRANGIYKAVRVFTADIAVKGFSSRLYAGDKVNVMPETKDKTAKITLKNLTPEIAKLDSAGNMTGLKKGYAKIEATASSSTFGYSVSRTAEYFIHTPEIHVDYSNIRLQAGKTQSISIHCSPEELPYSVESSDKEVFTVKENVVKAVGEGNAKLIVKCGSEITKIPVTVYKASHTVKFNANGGKNKPKNLTKYYGRTLYLPSQTPKRRGYVFLDWECGSKHYKAGAAFTPDKNVTLKARWKKVTVKTAYTPKLKKGSAGEVFVKWKSAAGAEGYLIQYSTHKLFKANVKSKQTYGSEAVLQGLKSGKKYYVRMCAYKLDSCEKKVKGKYSKTAAVRVR